MSSNQSHPGGGEGNKLKPASADVSHYGTFSPPVAEPASSAAQPLSGNMRSGYQPVAGDEGDYNTAPIPARDGEAHSDDETGYGTAGRSTVARRGFRHLTAILVAISVFALFALAACILYASQTPPPSSHPPPPPPVRILVIGDSITQGHEGDYTWRYRLWQWLRAGGGADVTFVGPYPGTFPPTDVAPPPGEPQPTTTPDLETRVWGGYALDADPAFSGADSTAHLHFAHWGRQAGQVKEFAGGVVADGQPDHVLVALGFNDIVWFQTEEQTLESVRAIVQDARAARPDARFAVANVPQRAAVAGYEWLPGKTDRYNAALEELLAELRTDESPVWLVRLREEYDCEATGCPASHDGLHPNALGEFQIAKAFSRVLHEKYGLGDGNLTIPAEIPPRPCPAPENVKLDRAALVGNVRPVVATWDFVYGAFGYHVSTRQEGSDWGWDMFTEVSKYDMFWPGDGQEWEVRVRTYCGDQQDPSPWSDAVSVEA